MLDLTMSDFLVAAALTVIEIGLYGLYSSDYIYCKKMNFSKSHSLLIEKLI